MTLKLWPSTCLSLVTICLFQSSLLGWQVGEINQTLQGSKAIASMQSAVSPQQAPLEPLPKPSPQMQQYLDQLLAYWEDTSSQVNLYECDFTRWQYDPQLCNWRNPENNRLAAQAISQGKIRFANPDKGMYEVTKKWKFLGPPKQPGAPPEYSPAGNEIEKWICDGKAIYEFDYANKRLYDLAIPPESQGEALKNSPLPFVFGAKATDLKERYWFRDITPNGVQDQYWLEAWPKTIDDASVYKKVEIILTRDPFLPKSIHIYASNYDEKLNPVKIVFEFEGRKINGNLAIVANFLGHFIRPKTPTMGGWERVPRKLINQQAPNGLGQNPNGTLGSNPNTGTNR